MSSKTTVPHQDGQDDKDNVANHQLTLCFVVHIVHRWIAKRFVCLSLPLNPWLLGPGDEHEFAPKR